MDDFTHERWLPVVGYEGLYEVSDMGRVRSQDRRMRCGPTVSITGWRVKPGKIMKLHLTERRKCYWAVGLTARDGTQKRHKVHRLVGEAFLGPLPPGMQTRHGPGGPLDNRLVNLSYGTSADDGRDRMRDGNVSMGSHRAAAKLTEQAVLECRIRYQRGGITHRELADEFGVSNQTMGKALAGKTWRHVVMS